MNEIKEPYGFIYITTNMINGKRYIGQRKFNKGWNSYLGSGTCLKHAIKVYGRKNFHRDIISIAYSKEELDNLEIEWISNYNASYNRDYYNITIGGSSVVGNINQFNRKVACLNTNIIYNSIVNASVKNNTDTSSIIGCCNGRILSSGKSLSGEKLVWVYYDDYIKMTLTDIANKIYWANNSIKGENCYRASKVVCLNSKKIFNTIQEASQYYDCGCTHISSCCRGNRHFSGKDKNTGKQLAWAYYDNFLKMTDEEIQEILKESGHKKSNPNKKGREVFCITTCKRFISAKKASEYYKIDSSAILKNCKNKLKSYGMLEDCTKLVWMYYEDYIKQNQLIHNENLIPVI
jgi:group I intron endonuclease